jgi:hypothetical protein
MDSEINWPISFERKGSNGFSYAYFFCPVGRPGCGEVHKVNTRDKRNEYGNRDEDVNVLQVPVGV